MRIWVVCPCFFDTASFRRVREEALVALRSAAPNAEVTFVLVDDTAGQDHAVPDVAALPDVQVIAPPYNLGHQGALVYALRRLGDTVRDDDFIVTMDSDGEDQPADLAALLAPLLSDPDNVHKVSLARRTRRHEGLAFKTFYAVFKLVFRTLTGTVIRSGNFVAYRGWLLNEVIHHPHFDHCYSSSFISLPMQTVPVPLARGRRFAGRSHMGFGGLFVHGVRMLMPFGERIAARGIIVSAPILVASVAALIATMVLRANPMWPMFGVCFATLTLGLCVLLFATFSHSKARNLRGLQDGPRPPR